MTSINDPVITSRKNSLILKEEQISEAPLWSFTSCRLQIIILLMFCYFTSSLIVVNFGLNLTCMVKDHNSSNTSVHINPKCERSVNRTHHSYGGTLNWSRHDEDMLLSATSWGSLLAQLPSMWIARQFKAKNVLFFVIALHVFFNALIPIFAIYIGLTAVFLLRIFIGIAHSFIDVSIYYLIDKWFPKFERSTALAIFAIGGQIAGIVGGPITTHICASSLGWQANFYLTSFLGGIFCIFWFFFSAEDPSSCKRIRKSEYSYLNENVHVKERVEKNIPYKAILLSFPVWAEFIMQITTCVAQNITQSYLPSFFKDVVLVSVIMNGYFVAIPNLCSFIVRLTWSIGIDYMKKRKILSQTSAVKLSQGISSLGLVTFFIIFAYCINCSNPGTALAVSSLIACSQSLESAGHITSLLSLAPHYTETLSAMSMFWAQSARIATPYAVGALRKDPTNGWQHVFLMAAGLNAGGVIWFLMFGSGIEQKWAKPDTKGEQEEVTRF